ncbi:VanZ family protein [Arachidicoccus sp.]|uniref:VanZ family protein n=1 Tax=Arachidicoccus sp. TaxID=1872624 RepID=UPI003D232E05
MKRKTSFVRFIPFLLWIVLVYILLTLPGKDFGSLEIDIPNLDKIVHMGLFGGVVFWFGFAFFKTGLKKSKKRIILITLLSCIYGITMEYVQKYFTHHTRDFSYGDMIADSLGAIIAFFLVEWIIKKYQTHQLTKLGNNTTSSE